MSENTILMDTKAVSKLLQVSIKTVYTWIYKNQLPKNVYRKLGRKPIFIYDEVMKWFLDGAQFQERHTESSANTYKI